MNSYSFKKKSIMESACNLNGSVSVLCGSSVRHGPQSASYSSLITSPSLSCMSIQPVLFPTKFLGFVDFFFFVAFCWSIISLFLGLVVTRAGIPVGWYKLGAQLLLIKPEGSQWAYKGIKPRHELTIFIMELKAHSSII